MDTHDQHLPADLYAEFLHRMPLTCVDLILETERGVLLVERENEPAKGEWFWPGARIRKGERLVDAVHRVADDELDIAVDVIAKVGVFEHFWDKSAHGSDVSQHAVVHAYHVRPPTDGETIDLDGQHARKRFVTTIEPDLHEYVRAPLEASQLVDR